MCARSATAGRFAFRVRSHGGGAGTSHRAADERQGTFAPAFDSQRRDDSPGDIGDQCRNASHVECAGSAIGSQGNEKFRLDRIN